MGKGILNEIALQNMDLPQFTLDVVAASVPFRCKPTLKLRSGSPVRCIRLVMRHSSLPTAKQLRPAISPKATMATTKDGVLIAGVYGLKASTANRR